jgi:hypothetical protein
LVLKVFQLASKEILCVGLIFLMVLCAGCTTDGGPKKPKDSDKDGYPDAVDAFPNDPKEWKDTDNDTHGDNSDAFPSDPKEWLDSDNDSHGDNSDRFPFDKTEWKDSDNDTYGDNRDKFPLDPKEWNDTDGDGHGDNSDKFPSDPLDWNDTDGDGVGDHLDRFPLDPTEWDDSDNDGIGDNLDDYNGLTGFSANVSISASGSYHYGSDYCVYGLVTNNKTRTVGGGAGTGFNITIFVYNNGTLFKEEWYAGVGSTNFSLLPGESLPVSVQIKDPNHQANSFKIVAMAGYINATPRRYLLAQNITGSFSASAGGYTMNGTMFNNVSVTLTNIHYAVAFYDDTNKLVDARGGVNQGAFLYPGKSALISAFSPSPYANTIVSAKVCFSYK